MFDNTKLTNDEIINILNNGTTRVEDNEEQFHVILASKNYDDVQKYDSSGLCDPAYFDYEEAELCGINTNDIIYVAVHPINDDDAPNLVYIYGEDGVQIVNTTEVFND